MIIKKVFDEIFDEYCDNVEIYNNNIETARDESLRISMSSNLTLSGNSLISEDENNALNILGSIAVVNFPMFFEGAKAIVGK